MALSITSIAAAVRLRCVKHVAADRFIFCSETLLPFILASNNLQTIKHIIETGHNAGIAAAQNTGVTALTMSGIMNITAVLKGEKSADEAITDTVVDTGKAVGTGYVMGGGLTTISHSLSNSNSKFIQALTKSNVPGKVITAVILTGDTLKRYAIVLMPENLQKIRHS